MKLWNHIIIVHVTLKYTKIGGCIGKILGGTMVPSVIEYVHVYRIVTFTGMQFS